MMHGWEGKNEAKRMKLPVQYKDMKTSKQWKQNVSKCIQKPDKM